MWKHFFISILFVSFLQLSMASAKPIENTQDCSSKIMTDKTIKTFKKYGSLSFRCKKTAPTFASSYLKSPKLDANTYSPDNIHDTYLDSAWCVKKGEKDQTETIIVPGKIAEGSYLSIFSGYGKSLELFRQNNRLRKIRFFIAKATRTDEIIGGIKTGKIIIV